MIANVLALCSGVGGLELGVGLAVGAAARVVCHVEREAYAAAVLAARMEDGTVDPAPIWSDVKSFDARPWRRGVDIVTGGYPCQPFSHAGKRLGVDDPRHLWPDFARIIGECQPEIVFCENVSAHLRNGFDVVARDMEGMGYRVAATLQTAAEHGAWHRRERLFWAAARDADGESESAFAVDAEMAGQPCDTYATDADCEGPQRHGAERGLEPATRHAREIAPIYRGWESEPDVGRVADGVASRVDRLRACGNGVVPVVAANALLELLNALHFDCT
ncbi:MAG: DNA cytosine methyltransferase [Planctomycetota bacterium]|nr:DNA cytosine methyltransferase [Planctomycetota bacterium]